MKQTRRRFITVAPIKRFLRAFRRVRLIAEVVGLGVDRLKRDLRATRLGRTTAARLTVRVIQELGDDDATHMAASVSYYAVLSLFPLALGLSTIISTVADSPDQQDQVIAFVVEYLPGSEAFVRHTLSVLARNNTAFGVVSFFSLLWAGSAVFGGITRAVNRAWDVEKDPPFYKNKPRQLLMAAGVSLLFFVSVGATSMFRWATTYEVWGAPLEERLGGVLTTIVMEIPVLMVGFLIFAIIYKFLPNTKTYWRYIWLGALIAAGLFEGGKHLFIWYLDNFADYNQLYGSVASVVVLMVWAYFSAFILILGAEIASEYRRLKLSIERGQEIEGPVSS